MKMLIDYLKLALRNIWHRRLRSLLTVIGILIGVAAVVALISLGQGLQQAIGEEFERFGYNVITLFPGDMRGFRGGFVPPSVELNVEVIKEIEGVEAVAEMLNKSAYVKIKELEGFLPVVGISQEMEGFLGGRGLKEGRMFVNDEEKSVILGSDIADDLKVKPGEGILIEEGEFQVVGILEETGDPGIDEGISIPIDTLREIYGEEGKVSFVFIRVKEGFDAKAIAEKIEDELKKVQGKEFTATTTEELQELVGGAIRAVQAFLAGIAGISLLVGGIGVMNTMYTSVLERTREIGVMKAVGATRRQVMWLFLMESGLLGLVGGVIGIILGLGISTLAIVLVRQFIDVELLQVGISWGLVVGALAFSFIIGIASGLLPARRASKLKPVEALRYE
jgi:putative ABC transport system permease protein